VALQAPTVRFPPGPASRDRRLSQPAIPVGAAGLSRPLGAQFRRAGRSTFSTGPHGTTNDRVTPDDFVCIRGALFYRRLYAGSLRRDRLTPTYECSICRYLEGAQREAGLCVWFSRLS
jgi:hypothetical protein